MYNIKKRRGNYNEDIKVKTLIKELKKENPEATVTICGDNRFFIHVECDNSVVTLDNEDLEECYESEIPTCCRVIENNEPLIFEKEIKSKENLCNNRLKGYVKYQELEPLILEPSSFSNDKDDYSDEEWKTICKVFNKEPETTKRIVISTPYTVEFVEEGNE